MKQQRFLNTKIDNCTTEEVIDLVNKTIKNNEQGYIVESNVDVILKIENDKTLQNAVNHSLLNLADGKPLIWISYLFKRPIVEKISGSDLIPLLLKNAEKEEQSVFLLGGKEEVLETAVKNIKNSYQQIKIAGYYSPPLGFEHDKEELKKIDEMILESQAQLLFVFLGCPKQEKWLYRHYKKTGINIGVCGGATVDFLAGNVKRAPKWMSDHGLEWFFRFLMEPKRLFRRYFIEGPTILLLVHKYWRERKYHVIRNFMHHDQ